MRILIATDAFPPVCGGSGWSTYELARGLRERGHDLLIVQPRPGRARTVESAQYDGFSVREYGFQAPSVPYLRNYLKNERLYGHFSRYLRQLIEAERIEVAHAQHVLTGPPTIAAAREASIPSVCTVRDYWPVCYWSDLIYDYDSSSLCPACSSGMMTQCIRPRAGAAWPAALPLIPYMLRNLAYKRRALSRADAVIAVSRTMARDLRERCPELQSTRLETIPNPVNLKAIRDAATKSSPPLEGHYAIYVGKLAPNKGTNLLIQAAEGANLSWPLVIVGDGPSRAELEDRARQSNLDVRFTGWLPREEALRWLAHAGLLLFPSYGPESLSRVLLEASSLGIAIAAMDTGGTRDIVTPGETGLLSTSVHGFAADIASLAHNSDLRARLGAAASASVEKTFDAEVVISQIDALYRDLVTRRAGAITASA